MAFARTGRSCFGDGEGHLAILNRGPETQTRAEGKQQMDSCWAECVKSPAYADSLPLLRNKSAVRGWRCSINTAAVVMDNCTTGDVCTTPGAPFDYPSANECIARIKYEAPLEGATILNQR